MTTKGRQARGAAPPPAPPLPPEQQQPILVPIGFRFNPTDLELVTYYLRKKLIGEDFPLNHIIIHEVNVYGYHPGTLAQTYRRANDNEWYIFTPRERKHVNGSCPNRMAVNGFWKATGSLFKIVHQGQVVGSKRTLVFFEGESKHGIKTNWIMHEYVDIKDDQTKMFHYWVCCRIYYNGKLPTHLFDQLLSCVDTQPISTYSRLEASTNVVNISMPPSSLCSYSQCPQLDTSYYTSGPSTLVKIGSSHFALPAPIDTLPPPTLVETLDCLLTQIPQATIDYSNSCPIMSTTPTKKVYPCDSDTGTTTKDGLPDFSQVTDLSWIESGFFDANSDDFLSELDFLLE